MQHPGGEDAAPALTAEDAFHPGPLFDALPAPAMIVDPDGLIHHANAAMHDLLGHAPGALIRQPLAALRCDMVAEDMLAYLQRVTGAKQERAGIPFTFRNLAGLCVPVRVTARSLTVDGAPFVVACLHPAEVDSDDSAFAHRQWQLRLFSNLSSDYFYRARLDDAGSPEEIWPTTRFTAITGYTREAILAGGGWARFIHPDDLARLEHPRSFEPEDGPQRAEYRIITASGEVRWLRDSFQIVVDPESNEPMLFGAVSDITAQHATLEALQDSEAQLRRIFDAVSQSFALLDRDLNVVAANKKLFYDFERGYEKPLELGRSLVEQLPPDWRPLLLENAEATLKGEVRWKEVLWHLPNGLEEWAAVQLNPIIEDGEVVGISMCVEGIHRRKLAELALLESESQLRRIFETVSQGFALLDRDLCVEAANQQMLREFQTIFGVDLVLGQRFPDGLPESWREQFLADAQTALEGHYSYREYHHPESGARSEWFEMEMNPIIEDGRVVGINLCADEIDRRKQAEEALQQAYLAMEEKVAERTRELQAAYDQLRESEERLRLIAERASDVIWHIDGMSHVLYMSPAFERVFGWPVSALVEEGVDIAFPVGKREELNAALDDHLEHWRRKGQHPPTLTQEAEYRHRDGHSFFAEINMDFAFPNHERWVKYGREEDYPHILGVSRDLTERKRQKAERQQLEQQVLHAQKIESLGVLAGGIAHDFNNLLVGIMGYSSLATMELPADHPVQEYVQQIEAASQRAADLTQQMLAYSGRGQFIVQPVGVSELTREMAHLLATVVSKKAAVQYALAEDLPTVRADATQIRQVVMNLITNASEALEGEPGAIRLSTGLCTLSERDLRTLMAAENAEPGEFVYLEVSDTGCGMDADTLARIFDPFYTTKFTGRGLGLGAVHGIIRGHHGAVRVDSILGKGAAIRVMLPVSGKAMPTDTAASPGPVERARGEKVLVVDDDESVREFARHSLELGGYRVVMARNGIEALGIMEREGERVHAVLLDLTMPEMGGAEALGILRERWPAVPVVVSSGHAEQQALDDAGGLLFFLHKPYHPDLLRRIVRQAIGEAEAPATGN